MFESGHIITGYFDHTRRKRGLGSSLSLLSPLAPVPISIRGPANATTTHPAEFISTLPLQCPPRHAKAPRLLLKESVEMSRTTLIVLCLLSVGMASALAVLHSLEPPEMAFTPMPADGSAPKLPEPIEIR